MENSRGNHHNEKYLKVFVPTQDDSNYIPQVLISGLTTEVGIKPLVFRFPTNQELSKVLPDSVPRSRFYLCVRGLFIVCWSIDFIAMWDFKQ